MQQDFSGWNETCDQAFETLDRKFMIESAPSSFTHRYSDNSIVGNAALNRPTYARKSIYKIICNRTFLDGMKHASKYLNVWTVNLWSKIPLLASRTGTGTIVLYEMLL